MVISFISEAGFERGNAHPASYVASMRDQQAAILSITPRARHQLEQMIQTCRDRVAGKAKPTQARSMNYKKFACTSTVATQHTRHSIAR